MLFTQLIHANLRTQKIGKYIEHYTTIDSTNLEAFRLIDEGSTEGMVVTTDIQTHGKGRRGRNWFTQPGKGIACSIILNPNVLVEKGGLISILSSLAVAEAIEQLAVTLQLKWPNDIIVNRKKCGGILCESRITADKIAHVVVGIGLNVNETQLDFPEEIRNSTTSIFIENGKSIQRELVLAWILNAFEKHYLKFLQGEVENIKRSWLNRCSHLNALVGIIQDGEIQKGIFRGISDEGNGLVEINEKIVSLTSEEISLEI